MKKSTYKRIIALVLSCGPGIFAIGYTIGTGSVTSMIVAGSTYGMQLLWVLFFSCLFSGVLIYAYGNYALVTGETALYGFKKYIKGGKILAILVIVGVSFGQWNSLMGILGISSSLLYEVLVLNFTSLESYKYEITLAIAVLVISVFYSILLLGDYTFFEKVLIIFVVIMGLSFIISLFFVYPLPLEVAQGLIPSIPDVPGSKMMIAAFVGTTMAAATFISRPLFLKGKGWTIKNLKQQKVDAITAAILVFVISGSIMAVASGALYSQGKIVNQVLDMAETLKPVAGSFAVTVFFFGTISAGLSSIFPCLMIAPLLVADYKSGKLDTNSRQFRLITFAACFVALFVPIFGVNAIEMQILTQVFNVFILPVVIIGIIIIINQKKIMGKYKVGTFVNVVLFAALFFSLVISYNGILALIDYLT